MLVLSCPRLLAPRLPPRSSVSLLPCFLRSVPLSFALAFALFLSLDLSLSIYLFTYVILSLVLLFSLSLCFSIYLSIHLSMHPSTILQNPSLSPAFSLSNKNTCYWNNHQSHMIMNDNEDDYVLKITMRALAVCCNWVSVRRCLIMIR